MPAPSPAPARRWRVNIDVQHGTVASHPGLPPGSLIADVLGDGVPAAVIDLDRSTGTSTSTALLETAVRRHPGRLWVGGRLTPGDPAIPRLLEAGAAGALIGSTGLFPAGLLQPANWPDFAALAPAGRLMLSVDALDGHVVTDGFTRPTGLPLDDALDALITATSSAHPILVTDAGAATRRTPPPGPPSTVSRPATRTPTCGTRAAWPAGRTCSGCGISAGEPSSAAPTSPLRAACPTPPAITTGHRP